MSRDLNMNTLSAQDVIDTYKNYDASEEAKEPILYFVSELLGISVDTLVSLTEGE
jgi:hypothetical protein